MEGEVGPSNGEKSNNDQFIDRSKVRILVCDNDPKGCDVVVSLLSNCSYQVTAVRSPRQVIDALNAEGPNIDIILSEVDLPIKKGFKLLKYITRDKDLQRIPVIMMSTQDEVSLVVKCLRLGAADFLVKPLRSNELLNLWTHMWRRRRMLGLAEKNIITYDFDLAASDPSDANTNSTTLFSDDTDDQSRQRVNPEMSMSIQQEHEFPLLPTDKPTATIPLVAFDYQPSVPGISDRRSGQYVCFPQKRELKIGECSAFFTYIKSNTFKNNSQPNVDVGANSTSKNSCQPVVVVDIEGNASQTPRLGDDSEAWHEHIQNESRRHGDGDIWKHNSHGEDLPRSTSVPNSTSMERSCTPPVWKNNSHGEDLLHSSTSVPDSTSLERSCTPPVWKNNSHGEDVLPSSTSIPDSTSLERSCTPPVSMEFMMPNKSNDESSSQVSMHPRNGSPFDVSGFAGSGHYPYYIPGMMNQLMMPSSQMPPHYNHLPHCPSHVTGMAPFSYCPMGMGLQQSQLPPHGNLTASEPNLSKVDRREAALIKFRQKRKQRCFDKKIRYVNRKKLAERRPRVRGQFVRKANGVMVDLNGYPSPVGLNEEDEDDDPTSKDSSPEDDEL